MVKPDHQLVAEKGSDKLTACQGRARPWGGHGMILGVKEHKEGAQFISIVFFKDNEATKCISPDKTQQQSWTLTLTILTCHQKKRRKEERKD